MKHPFDDAFGVPPPRDDADAPAASRQRRWEHRCVRRLLDHFGLTGVAPVIARETAGLTGFRYLDFTVFRQHYPSFPVRLSFRRVAGAHRVSCADLVDRWTKTAAFRAFLAAEADLPDDYHGAPLGLVYAWPKVLPAAIMHNCYRASEAAETVFVRLLRHCDPPVHMAIQSFDSFLCGLRWRPG